MSLAEGGKCPTLCFLNHIPALAAYAMAQRGKSPAGTGFITAELICRISLWREGSVDFLYIYLLTLFQL